MDLIKFVPSKPSGQLILAGTAIVLAIVIAVNYDHVEFKKPNFRFFLRKHSKSNNIYKPEVSKNSRLYQDENKDMDMDNNTTSKQ
ncbi:unnamed protein product [Diamesa hyperborea]